MPMMDLKPDLGFTGVEFGVWGFRGLGFSVGALGLGCPGLGFSGCGFKVIRQ